MENASTIERKASELADRIARREGFELFSLEYIAGGRSSTLRVTLDHEDGVTVEDCAGISRQLSVALDVEDIVPREYRLEVSSPGIDRALTGASDFMRFDGHRVRIKTRESFRGRKEFCGLLEGVRDQRVVVAEPGGGRFEIPLDRVALACLDPEILRPKGR